MLACARSGVGGAPLLRVFFPTIPRMPARPSSTTVTIRAASQGLIAFVSARMIVVMRVAKPKKPRNPAAANKPMPAAACLPFSLSSAWASLISSRISWESFSERVLTSSPRLGRSSLRPKGERVLLPTSPRPSSSITDGRRRW